MAAFVKRFRMVTIFIMALVCLATAYLAGYGRGHEAAVRDDTRFGLVSYLSLYKFEQQGDTNRLADRLRFMIYSYSDYYDRYFASEAVTSTNFLGHVMEARVIASQERTQVVSVESALQQLNTMLRTNMAK